MDSLKVKRLILLFSKLSAPCGERRLIKGLIQTVLRGRPSYKDEEVEEETERGEFNHNRSDGEADLPEVTGERDAKVTTQLATSTETTPSPSQSTAPQCR